VKVRVFSSAPLGLGLVRAALANPFSFHPRSINQQSVAFVRRGAILRKHRQNQLAPNIAQIPVLKICFLAPAPADPTATSFINCRSKQQTGRKMPD
jgi:hypothetical protein